MSIKDTVLIALFAAIMAVLAIFPPITLPIVPTPITAQSLGVMLAGGILGAKRGFLSLVLFLFLVLIGLPLLPGGRGGVSVFFGVSSGFLLSWPIAALLMGYAVEKLWHQLSWAKVFSLCVLTGIGVVYIIGVPWLAVMANLSLTEAFMGSAVFIIGDLVKAAIATSVILTVSKAYPVIKASSLR
ncbi:biotin transporter BioY [Vibrio sp.]|nr:biotin transporter BioY [Vibrio sp.]